MSQAEEIVLLAIIKIPMSHSLPLPKPTVKQHALFDFISPSLWDKAIK